MVGLFRRIWGAFWGYLDVVGRVDDLEDAVERLKARQQELELEWVSQVDRLAKMHQRGIARLQSATAAMAEAHPTVTDVRLDRRARIEAARARHGNRLKNGE